MRLLSRRPLVLLGSLWLVTVCVAAVASHRLLFADPGRSSGGALAQSQSPHSSGLATSPDTNDGVALSAERSRHNVKVILWGLSSLVGLCALGSVVISQRAKAVARRKPKRRVRRVKPKAQAKPPTGPKRLQPYSPQRDAVIVKGAGAVADTLILTVDRADTEPAAEIQVEAVVTPVAPSSLPEVSPARMPPRLAPPSRPGSPLPSQSRDVRKKARPPMAPQNAPQNIVAAAADVSPPTEVVSPDEAHPLDWAEDSLAHALDLRQRRSLSSLM